MKRLLNIEWNKMFYNKGTRIFLILYFVLIAAMGMVLPNFKPTFNGVEVNFVKLGALNFPVIWHNISWLIGFGKYFLAIIIINNISNEYSFGTLKQNIIDGLSKIDFFKSKIYMNFFIVLASTLLVFVIVITLGAIFSENFKVFKGIEFLLAYFVEIFSFIIFVMFLTFLLKKSSFAILALFVLYIFESILVAIEFFAIKGFASKQVVDLSNFYAYYLPLSANSKMIGYPPGNIMLYLQTGKFFDASHVKWDFLTANILYSIVFMGLSYLLIKRRDL